MDTDFSHGLVGAETMVSKQRTGRSALSSGQREPKRQAVLTPDGRLCVMCQTPDTAQDLATSKASLRWDMPPRGKNNDGEMCY